MVGNGAFWRSEYLKSLHKGKQTACLRFLRLIVNIKSCVSGKSQEVWCCLERFSWGHAVGRQILSYATWTSGQFAWSSINSMINTICAHMDCSQSDRNTLMHVKKSKCWLVSSMTAAILLLLPRTCTTKSRDDLQCEEWPNRGLQRRIWETPGWRPCHGGGPSTHFCWWGRRKWILMTGWKILGPPEIDVFVDGTWHPWAIA